MDKTDAIRMDVSAESTRREQEENAAALSDRDLAMQEIEEQLNHQTDVPAHTPQDQETLSDVHLPEILADEHMEKVKVRVKVDGQVVEMPLSEVTKGYQKDAVASRRLAQAAEERKALEAKERAIEERERQLAAAKTPPSSLDEDEDVNTQIAAAMNALIEGDETAATEALKTVLQGRRASTTPAIDEEALIEKAAQRIEQQRIAEENAKAWNEFVGANEAFADENSKERQYGDYLFNTKYTPQIASGEISYREALSRAAEEVAEVFKAPESAPQNSRKEKEERKKSIDNLPVAGARNARQPEPEETTEDVLAEMRKQRGQPI